MGYMDELLTREYFDLVDEGDRLYEDGNLVEARNRFEQASEIFGRLMEEEGSRLEEALDRVTRALVDQNLEEADRLKADGQLELARERYAVALSLVTDPSERDEILIKMEYRATLQPATNFPENLQRLFAELDRSPDAPEVLYALATELAIEGHPSEAVRYLERLVSLTPEDPDGHFRLGCAMADVKAYDRARRSFEQARELGFDASEIDFRLGRLARNRGDHATAIRHFEAAVEANPDHLDALKALASIHDVDDRPGHAIDCFTRAAALDPEDAALQLRLGELHEAAGDVSKARQAWRQAVKVEPDSEAAGYARERLEEMGLDPDAEDDGD